jgi:hypothetical protein
MRLDTAIVMDALHVNGVEVSLGLRSSGSLAKAALEPVRTLLLGVEQKAIYRPTFWPSIVLFSIAAFEADCCTEASSAL